jgi:nitrogen fixation protein FixH
MHTSHQQAHRASDGNIERSATTGWGMPRLHAIIAAALVAVMAASAFVATANGDATAAGGARLRHKPKQISAASAFILPPLGKCLGSEITLQLRQLPHVRWIGGSVEVNGKRVKTIARSQVSRPVRIRNLPLGRIVLSVTAVTSNGRSVTATHVYRACDKKPAKPKKTVEPPAPVNPPGQPPQSGDLSPQPGSYRALASGYEFTFYVSPDGSKLQDVSLSGLSVRCAPGNGAFGVPFYIPEIAIASDGSFSVTRTEEGDVSGTVAEFTYTFNGQVQGTSATGALRADVTYDNGVSYSCTSNITPWSATRDAQPSQTASPPEPGSYRALASGYEFTFYVSPDGSKLQDVSLSGLSVRCAPGNGAFGVPFYIPEIAIASDGSFSVTRTEEGDVSGTVAEFTYTFSGHFHGYNSAGRARIAGALRADVTYDDGTSRACTSNITPWSATRDAQPSQTLSPPEPGSYHALAPGYEFAFSVSSDGSHLQNVSLAGLGVRCAPGNGAFGVPFYIPEVAINGDGSFSATRTEAGVVSGFPAEFTYTFSGHFHGYNSAGKARVAGALRADVTYDNGVSRTCTSNVVPWSATH